MLVIFSKRMRTFHFFDRFCTFVILFYSGFWLLTNNRTTDIRILIPIYMFNSCSVNPNGRLGFFWITYKFDPDTIFSRNVLEKNTEKDSQDVVSFKISSES